MDSLKRLIPLCCLALASTAATGCFVEVADSTPNTRPTYEAIGGLTVRWTVADTTDPDACFGYGGQAADLELLVNDGEVEVGDFQAPCEAFELAIDLPPGRYNGLATLVDSGEDPVTTSLPVSDIDVVPDEELTIDIDFPVGSFL